MAAEVDRDVLAVDLIDALSELAIVVRERDPRGIRQALNATLALGGARAALVVAAAMIPADQPIDPWWFNPDSEQRQVHEADVRRAALAEAIGAPDDYRPGDAA